MQSPDSASDDRTTVNEAEPCPETAERSVPHIASLVPSAKVDVAPEGRSPQKKPASGLPGRVGGFVRQSLKALATLLILALAVVAALVIWDAYVTAPWTRDGSVRVQVASVAPQVSGQITEVRVVDNQFVHQGDVLYVIDPSDFRIALEQARAQEQRDLAALDYARQTQRRKSVLAKNGTVTEDNYEQVTSGLHQAEAAVAADRAAIDKARLDLSRTQVRSPVNGPVTNFLMRVGDYAHVGTTNISVIDADSYWIDGYFEETKLAHICIGDRAEAQLMGYRDPIEGQVQTVTRGISVSNAAPSTQGLPNVDPVYTWVRLAQRVPVRIRITHVPPGVPLVSGLTATVTIRGNRPQESGGWLRQRFVSLADHLVDVVRGPRPSPGCVPRVGDESGETVTLPTPEPIAPLSPEEINPGPAPNTPRRAR